MKFVIILAFLAVAVSGNGVHFTCPNGVPVPAAKSARLSEVMKYGYPSLDSLRIFDNYVLSYDTRHRTAHWVMEYLTPEMLNGESKRGKSDFHEDPTIHEYFKAGLDDYRGSGFDRGHLAPAGNYKMAQQSMDQTFILSNMSPQVGDGFNRNMWSYLEAYVRYRATKAKKLWVATGPLYLPEKEADGKNYVKYQVIGKNHVAVPTHFYKVFVAENTDGSLEMENYLLPNAAIDDQTPILSFQVPLEKIERAAGVILFPNLNIKRDIKKVNGDSKFLQDYLVDLEKMKEGWRLANEKQKIEQEKRQEEKIQRQQEKKERNKRKWEQRQQEKRERRKQRQEENRQNA